MRKTNKRKLGYRLLGFALVVSVLATWQFVRAHDRLLPRDATFVADTTAWIHGQRIYNKIRIHWLCDHEVMYSRIEGPDGHVVIYKRDTRTGSEKELRWLTDYSAWQEDGNIDSEQISPDGRWFIRSARWKDCFLAEVNGPHIFMYGLNTSLYHWIFWTTDGRHWIEWVRSDGKLYSLLLRDVEHPEVSKSIPADGHADILGCLMAMPSLDDAIAVVDSDSNAPVYDMSDRPLDTPLIEHAEAPHYLEVYHFSLDGGAKLQRQYDIAVPECAKDYDLTISPRGDRIAWRVAKLQSDPIRALIHRVLPSVKPRTQRVTELWVCNVDGSGFHEIGRIVDSLITPADAPLWLSLSWLPSEECLSFEYHDRLYTIPSD